MTTTEQPQARTAIRWMLLPTLAMFGIGTPILIAAAALDHSVLALSGAVVALCGLAVVAWAYRAPTDPASVHDRRIRWRAHNVARWQFTRRHRRALVITEAAAVAAVAVALPVYLKVVGMGWTAGGGTPVRPAPPNLDTVESWALWVAYAGACAGAGATLLIVGVSLTRQRAVPADQWARVPAAAGGVFLASSLWVLSSIATTDVIVNALVMT